jgi:DNA polymerase-1
LRQTFDKVPDALLWPYAGLDALGTYRLALTYAQRLKARPNLWKFFREESEPLIRPLAKAEWKGADLDTSAVRRLHDEYEQEQVKLLQDMRAKLWPEFNPSSNPQVLRAFGNLGLPDVELEAEESASGYSANKKKLTELIEKGQEPAATFSKQLLTYRNRSKLIGTYLVNAEQDRNADGRLRYTWFQAGPVTGRLSCRFFHQIPKLDEDRVNQGKLVMRDILKVPQGYKYIYGDFKQIELFIMAILSQDQELIKILYGGGDLHTITAFEFLSVVWPGLTEADISKFNRVEVGKKINFGLSYGSEGYSLIKQGKWRDKHGVDHNFTWEMLNQGMLNWRARFHGVGKFTETVPDIVRAQGGTATNAFGRERHFGPLLNQPNVAARSRCEREAINFFIQSLATAITNRTIIEVDRMLERFNVPEDVVCLINTVHDSVAYEVRDDYVEWFSDALHTIATRPIPEMGNAIFNMDIGVGDNWASAEMAA